VDLERADERGVQGGSREEREDVFKENAGSGEVGVLPQGGAEGGFEEGEFLGRGARVGHF